MTTATKARPKTKRPARDVAQDVTDRIMQALETGVVPWHKPWTSRGILPTSISTGKVYRGVNAFLLGFSQFERGYGSPLWGTFKQWGEFGGTVRHGEHGTTVVFWKRLTVKDTTEGAPDDATKVIPLMRYFTVFNEAQVEGATLPKRFQVETREPVEPGEAVEDMTTAYVAGPSLSHKRQDRAFYRPSEDSITLPQLDQFESTEGYFSTLAHEFTHSTGHASRLNRFERNGEPTHFGSEVYAREELVAEMGSAMLQALYGVENGETDQSAAYVAGWLRALKEDKGLVVKAAQQAQRAVDRIVGTEYTEEAKAA